MLLVDGFIKNRRLLDEIKKEHHWSNIPKYNWWDGWWKIKPRKKCLKEKVFHFKKVIKKRVKK